MGKFPNLDGNGSNLQDLIVTDVTAFVSPLIFLRDMRFQLISLAVFAVLLVSLTVRVDSTCTGIFPPYVPYPTSNVRHFTFCFPLYL